MEPDVIDGGFHLVLGYTILFHGGHGIPEMFRVFRGHVKNRMFSAACHFSGDALFIIFIFSPESWVDFLSKTGCGMKIRWKMAKLRPFPWNRFRKNGQFKKLPKPYGDQTLWFCKAMHKSAVLDPYDPLTNPEPVPGTPGKLTLSNLFVYN